MCVGLTQLRIQWDIFAAALTKTVRRPAMLRWLGQKRGVHQTLFGDVTSESMAAPRPPYTYTMSPNKRSKINVVPPPRVAQIWPHSGKIWLNVAQAQSNLVDFGLKLAEIGANLT